MNIVENELKVEICQKHIWLDSQSVLNWIQSETPLGTFVENKVKEVKTDKDIKFTTFLPQKIQQMKQVLEHLLASLEMIEYGGMAQNGSYNHNRHGQSERELLLTKKRLRYNHRLNPS